MKRIKLTILSLCVVALAQAKVTLPAFFTDHMVIQQNSVLTFPGKAKAGKQVTVKVSWDNRKYTAKAAADGNFRIEVPTPAAGGPYMITLSDGETLKLNNVMSGEVWLCSGQSNMEMPVAGWGKVMNYEQEIANADYPSIRLLQVKKTIAFTPQDNVEMNMGGWQPCSSATVPEFSSVAYFFARKLWKELNIPVGVIDCTWGGTPAEAWTSYQTLKQVMGFQDKMAQMNEANFDRDKLIAAYQEEMKDWQDLMITKDAGFLNNTPIWISALQKGKEWKTMELPGYWETKGLSGFDGTAWFQKEIEIPAEWAGKKVALNLGMIDDDEITYYNGKEIARTSGCNTMRNYTIPAELVKSGKGIITVRVLDTGGEGGFHGEAQNMYMELEGKKIPLAGAWNYRIGMSMSEMPSRPASPEFMSWPTSCYPTVLFNAMINPLTVFPIKGAIWYQGENNVGFAEQYTTLFQSMITDWRKAWNTTFPFYFVQLANYLQRQEVQADSKWAALREAQIQALHLEKTGVATAIDLGEAFDIHPKNKQEVGLRLATLALADTYGKGKYEYPAYQDYRIKGRTLILTFDREVVAKGATAKAFTIAGPDKVFHPAKATLNGKEVILEAEQVEIPVAAGYGWADNPECNLYGTSGLPVIPFRTDK